MFKFIRKYFLKEELKILSKERNQLLEKRAQLVYKPLPGEIPKRLKKCEEIADRVKKIDKRILKINKKISE
jgi:hypothetical protein